MREKSKIPLLVGDWTSITTPMGITVTLFRTPSCYRVTATNCYARRVIDPYTYDDERSARAMARKTTIDLLKNETRFDVNVYRNGQTYSYSVDLEGGQQRA